MRREQIKASPEHEKSFRTTFELVPELQRDPMAQDAYEHAATHKLYPDELNAIGSMIRRRNQTSEVPCKL